MQNEKIGLFDSGLGGLSILKTLVEVLPNENYLFYEDSIHNPYGEKSEEELLEITSSIVEYLLSKKCKIIVIACNTATTSCMKKLREKYPDTIFVGTVPAIKVACDHDFKNTVVLSTPYTSKSTRVNELIECFQKEEQDITIVSGSNLAHLIEIEDKEKIRKLLTDKLSKYQSSMDSIVLGCTHYSLIKEEFQNLFPNVTLLDGCLGVSLEVKRQLENKKLLNLSKKKGTITIENSKSKDLITRSYEFLER